MYRIVPINHYLKRLCERAIILRAEKKYAEALNYQKSIEHFFDESEPVHLRRFHNGMGINYFNLGHYELAIERYEKALSVSASDEAEELDRAAFRGNLANALVELNRTEEAHQHLDQAEKVLREYQIDDWLGDRLETRARAYLLEGKLEEANSAAEEAYKLHRVSFSEESIEVSRRTLDMCRDALETFARRGKARGISVK